MTVPQMYREMSKAEIRAYCDQIAPAEVVVGDYPDEVKMAPSSPVSTRKQSDESSDHREALSFGSLNRLAKVLSLQELRRGKRDQLLKESIANSI